MRMMIAGLVALVVSAPLTARTLRAREIEDALEGARYYGKHCLVSSSSEKFNHAVLFMHPKDNAWLSVDCMGDPKFPNLIVTLKPERSRPIANLTDVTYSFNDTGEMYSELRWARVGKGLGVCSSNIHTARYFLDRIAEGQRLFFFNIDGSGSSFIVFERGAPAAVKEFRRRCFSKMPK